MAYTQRFSEVHELLANLVVSSSGAEQNTGFVELGRFHRGFVQIIPVTLGGALDVDVEQATDTAGTGSKTFDAGGKDTTIPQTDTNPTIIEFRNEEFDVDNAFDALNIEVTPGGASTFIVQVWGTVPRKAPVATTNLEAVVD